MCKKEIPLKQNLSRTLKVEWCLKGFGDMEWKTKTNKEFLNDEISKEKLNVKRENANNKAKEYLNDKEKLTKLIKDAEVKSREKEDKKGFIQETWDSLKAMIELVKAYISGDYRNIPYGSILLIVGTVLYFVMPADVIPDFIAGLGFTDDATVIAITFKKVKTDLDKFLEWKNEREKQDSLSLRRIYCIPQRGLR